jgi:hypothetical protein
MSGLEAFAQFKTDGEIVGLEDITPDDIKMPKLKLAQPTSQEVTDEKCKQGEYINITTGVAYPTVPCHLLKVSKSRVKWPPQFKRGDAPDCRSFDGITSENGRKCKGCPDCVWEDGKRPACGVVYSWLGLFDDDSPFRMTFAGASISKVKDLLTQLKMAGLPAFAFNMELVSEKQKNDKGTYYITNFSLVKGEDGKPIPVTMEQFTKYKDTTLALADLFSRVQVADLSAYDEDVNVGEDSADPKKDLF